MSLNMQRLMQQQTIGLRIDRTRNRRAKTEHGFQSRQRVNTHAQINDHQVGVAREIDGAAIDLGFHLRSAPDKIASHRRHRVTVAALRR